MASEEGVIAAYVSRSLERKKNAEEKELAMVHYETVRPQGRIQTGRRNVDGSTPVRGG